MSKRKSASKHWDRLLFSHLVPEIPAQTAMFHQILLLKQLTSASRGSHPGTFHTQMLWLPLTKHFFLTVKKSSPLFLTWEISKRVGDPLVFEMLSQMTSTPNTHVTRIFGFHTWYDGTVTKYKGNTWILLCSYRHSSWEKTDLPQISILTLSLRNLELSTYKHVLMQKFVVTQVWVTLTLIM